VSRQLQGLMSCFWGWIYPSKIARACLDLPCDEKIIPRGEKYWLSGYKTFKTVEPFPPPGILYSTRQHPIQGFTWSDFSAKPEHEYTYEVFALRGTPATPQQAEKVAVKISTESEHGTTHHVHFNRGAAASQEYTRLFGDKRPEEVGPAAFTWLWRGAAESSNDQHVLVIIRSRSLTKVCRTGNYQWIVAQRLLWRRPPAHEDFRSVSRNR
jgi:hypothetical protein